MPDTRSRRSNRRWLLAVAAVIVAVAAACMPSDPSERAALDQLNRYRASKGLHALHHHDALHDKAHSWAQKLARDGRLAHSDLDAGVPSGWSALGENVASAGDVHQALNLLLSSPTHHANITSTRYTHVGIGAAVGRDGRTYLVQVFARY